MAMILWLATDVGSAARTDHWLVPTLRVLTPWATPEQLRALLGLVRKIGHLTEYAILATLWYRALVRARGVRPWAAGWIAFAISLGWAVLDETVQSLVPSRTGSGADVAIDGVGALLAIGFARLGWRRTADRAASLLLWIALAGGGLLLVLNALAGVRAGVLWLTVPAAALVLLIRFVHARSVHARSMQARTRLEPP
jgi:VanZ family protein